MSIFHPHSMCSDCWTELNPGCPARAGGQLPDEICCRCGRATPGGIYVRGATDDPDFPHCTAPGAMMACPLRHLITGGGYGGSTISFCPVCGAASATTAGGSHREVSVSTVVATFKAGARSNLGIDAAVLDAAVELEDVKTLAAETLQRFFDGGFDDGQPPPFVGMALASAILDA